MSLELSDEQRALLIEAYRERLQLMPTSTYPLPPTLQTLRLLTERHLLHIPFENLSLHTAPVKSEESIATAPEPAVVLSLDSLMDKLLYRQRGGCCLELNGLFRMLLGALGFPSTRLVPCWVYAGPERGHGGKKFKFRTVPSHFMILVEIPQDSSYLVDVGLGEPPLEPLEYATASINQVQKTCEGMTSRIVWDPRGTWTDGKGLQRTCLLLEWLRGTTWVPRLQWDVHNAPLTLKPPSPTDNIALTRLDNCGPTLESFRYVIGILTSDKSSFARKAIVCRLTRDEKITLSGRTLKVTSPRFTGCTGTDTHELHQTCTQLDTNREVANVLQERFGITLDTQELNLVTSDEFSNTPLWDHL
jgi:arylamine N-acetyltransferase